MSKNTFNIHGEAEVDIFFGRDIINNMLDLVGERRPTPVGWLSSGAPHPTLKGSYFKVMKFRFDNSLKAKKGDTIIFHIKERSQYNKSLSIEHSFFYKVYEHNSKSLKINLTKKIFLIHKTT